MKRYSMFLAILLITCFLLVLVGCSASISCPNCNASIDEDAVFCSKCGASVKHTHNFSVALAEEAYLKEPATCTAPATYYYSCECGEKGTESFSNGEAVHTFEKNVNDAYLKKKATCTTPATYYYSCSCGKKSNETFTNGATASHNYSAKNPTSKYLCSEATKTSPAKYYYACSVCQKSGTKTYEYGNPLQDSWGYNYYVDYQFGEKTDEWYVTTHELLDGTFENSATDDASLLVKILYDCNDEISIFLYEYADEDNLVKNNSSSYKDYYKIVIKNENGKTYEARGQMWPGGDRIYIIDTYHSTVLEMMKTSTTIKFFIQSEDSPTTQYRFEVDMSNFNDVVADMQ